MRRSLDAICDKASEVGCDAFERGDDRAGVAIANYLALFIEEQAHRPVRSASGKKAQSEPAPIAPEADW